jgi:hypothetical protein
MTQTASTETPTFFADHAQVMTAVTRGQTVTRIDVQNGVPAFMATTAHVYLSEHTAQFVLAQLAAQLGFRVISEETAQVLGADLRDAIEKADELKNSTPNGEYAFDRGFQIAAQHEADTLRDLRSALRGADLIAG